MIARKSLPIGIIIMILMLALASLGMGYAWWTEQLSAVGTIQTGTIDVQIGNAIATPNDPLNVATCIPTLSEDGKTMSIVINNGYPAFGCKIDFTLTNLGTVPAKITNVNLPYRDQNLVVIPTGALRDKPILDPTISETATILVGIADGAAQNSQYSFDFSIDIAQGNAP